MLQTWLTIKLSLIISNYVIIECYNIMNIFLIHVYHFFSFDSISTKINHNCEPLRSIKKNFQILIFSKTAKIWLILEVTKPNDEIWRFKIIWRNTEFWEPIFCKPYEFNKIDVIFNSRCVQLAFASVSTMLFVSKNFFIWKLNINTEINHAKTVRRKMVYFRHISIP